MDTQTERLIQRALDRLMEGRTTFVIAHRLAFTVRLADLIVVMERGEIVQNGNARRTAGAGRSLPRNSRFGSLANAAWQEEAEPVATAKPVYRTKDLA